MGSLVLINSKYPTDWCCKNTLSGIIFWKSINPRKYEENCEENHVGFSVCCGQRYSTDNWLAIMTNLCRLIKWLSPSAPPCLPVSREVSNRLIWNSNVPRQVFDETNLAHSKLSAYYAFLSKLSSTYPIR